MPIQGAGVKRTGKFADIERVIRSHGFARGAPNRMPSPGFYFYSRGGYVIQIQHGRKVGITKPDGTVETVSARRLVVLDSALDIVVMEIEEAEELKRRGLTEDWEPKR